MHSRKKNLMFQEKKTNVGIISSGLDKKSTAGVFLCTWKNSQMNLEFFFIEIKIEYEIFIDNDSRKNKYMMEYIFSLIEI